MKTLCFLFLLFASSLFYACQSKEKEKAVTHASSIVYPDVLNNMLDILKNNPDSNALRFKIAMAMDSIGDYPNALAQMDSLIKRDSVNYAYTFSKGRIYQNIGDTLHAILFFKKAISIYQDPEGMLYLANLLAEKKNAEALQIVKNVKSMRLSSTDNANCDFIAGVYYARSNDAVNAIKLLDQAVGEDYTLMPAYIEKGLVYFDHHNYSKALEIFRFASQINHLYPDAYYYMARSQEMMGQKDSAILRFKQAYSLDHSFVEAQNGLKRLGAD